MLASELKRSIIIVSTECVGLLDQKTSSRLFRNPVHSWTAGLITRACSMGDQTRPDTPSDCK